MLNQLKESIFAYEQAIALVQRYRLWRYAILPGLLCALLGSLLLWGVYHWAQTYTLLADSVGWMETALDIAVVLVTILGFLLTFKYLVLIVAAPFMSLLSEHLEEKMTGKATAPFSAKTLIQGVLRGMRLAVRNLLLELGFTLLFSLISFSGILAPVALVGALLVQAFYAGFGNLDYTLERSLNYRQSVAFVGQHRGLAVGNGLVFQALLLLPIIGWFLAPVYATVAGLIVLMPRLSSPETPAGNQ